MNAVMSSMAVAPTRPVHDAGRGQQSTIDFQVAIAMGV